MPVFRFQKRKQTFIIFYSLKTNCAIIIMIIVLLLAHTLCDSVSWSSALPFSSWLRSSFRPELSSTSSVIVPTETTASVVMANPWISVGTVWTSWSNRPLRFAEWACLLLSSSLWQEERGVVMVMRGIPNLTVFTWTVSHGFLSLSQLPAAFSAASVYSTPCNLGDSSGFSISMVCLNQNIQSVFAPLRPPAGLSVLSSSLSIEFSCCSSFRASDRRWTAELSAFCCLWEHRLSVRLLQTGNHLRHRKQSWTSCCEEKLKHIKSSCPIWILWTNQKQTSFDWCVLKTLIQPRYEMEVYLL